MRLDEAVKEFESKFEVVNDEVGFPGGKHAGQRDWSRAPTGQRYVTVTSAGIKHQGEQFAYYHHDEDSAAREWLSHALSFAYGRFGTLHWRERPRVEVDGDLHPLPPNIVVYSRFQVDGKE